MGIIFDINRKVERICKLTKERENKEHRPFGDILREEINRELSEEKFDDNWTKEKAIQDTDQSNQR